MDIVGTAVELKKQMVKNICGPNCSRAFNNFWDFCSFIFVKFLKNLKSDFQFFLLNL